MKKFLAVVLALVMVLTTGVVAFAANDDDDKDDDRLFYQRCDPDPNVLRGGETVHIYTSDFYWKDTDKDSDTKGDYISYGGELYKDDFGAPIPSWKKGGSYVTDVFFKDGDDYVTLIIKSGIKTSTDKYITGTIKLRDKITRRTYTCTIGGDDLMIEVTDNKSEMYQDGDRRFSLPYDYQESKVKFVTEDGDDYGTFTADFDNDKGTKVAKYVVKIVDQDSLFLGFNETENTALTTKYNTATMRFINWDARPTFELEGSLSIYMKPNEYIYGIKDDNSLYRLGGSYDTTNSAYVIKTKTLGSYVVSSKALMDHTTSKPLDPSVVNNPKPASSSVAPAPSSSSVAPPPSSSAPESSSSEPSSSEPAPEPSSSEPEPESKPADKKKDDEDADEDKEKKGGFPLVPVLLGVLVVVIVVCGVIVLGNQNGGRGGSGRSSSRRKKFDDWDD